MLDFAIFLTLQTELCQNLERISMTLGLSYVSILFLHCYRLISHFYTSVNRDVSNVISAILYKILARY